jgi:Flp pilus assembly protein TadG
MLVVLAGGAIDYSRADIARRGLQHAADSAALAVAQAQVLAIKEGSKDIDFEQRGLDYIAANAFKTDGLALKNITIDQNGKGYAGVTIEASIKNSMLNLAGIDEFAFTVVSEARFDQPPDMDFAFLMDRSGSMTIGANQSDIDFLQNHPKTQCAFACHPEEYYWAREQGIETRFDVAVSTIQEALISMRDIPHDMRGDIYAHIYSYETNFKNYGKDLVENVVMDNIPAQIKPTALGSNAARALGQAKTKFLATTGEDNRLFLLLITDGVRSIDGTEGRYVFDPADCQPLKDAGVTVAVIYTTYHKLNHHAYNVQIAPIKDQIQPALEACASDGWFFEAAFADDLRKAMKEIVEMAMPKPRLTY